MARKSTPETKIENVKIESVKRLPNTVNGNPHFTLATEHGTFTTYPDSQCAYGAESLAGKVVTLTLSGKLQRVVNINIERERDR